MVFGAESLKTDYLKVDPNIWGWLRYTWRFFDKYRFSRMVR